MSEEDYIEMEFYYTLMDAVYLIDRVGIDKFLESVIQYCENTEQEQIINMMLDNFVRANEVH